jgi:hypothetical protein
MKREMEENYEDSNCEEQQQQQEQDQSISPSQGNMEYEQDSNDFSESNNANTNQDNGPTNPPKRQRLTDDEEVRLLIPSKVFLPSFSCFPNLFR